MKTHTADSGVHWKAFSAGAGNNGWLPPKRAWSAWMYSTRTVIPYCSDVVYIVIVSPSNANEESKKEYRRMDEPAACKQPQANCARPGERIYHAVVLSSETSWCLHRGGTWDALVAEKLDEATRWCFHVGPDAEDVSWAERAVLAHLCDLRSSPRSCSPLRSPDFSARFGSVPLTLYQCKGSNGNEATDFYITVNNFDYRNNLSW